MHSVLIIHAGDTAQTFRRLLVEELRAHLQQAQEELAQGSARHRGSRQSNARVPDRGGAADVEGGGAHAFTIEAVQRRSDLHHIEAIAESFETCAAALVWLTNLFEKPNSLPLRIFVSHASADRGRRGDFLVIALQLSRSKVR